MYKCTYGTIIGLQLNFVTVYISRKNRDSGISEGIKEKLILDFKILTNPEVNFLIYNVSVKGCKFHSSKFQSPKKITLKRAKIFPRE